jgi:hypothetical protein
MSQNPVAKRVLLKNAFGATKYLTLLSILIVVIRLMPLWIWLPMFILNIVILFYTAAMGYRAVVEYAGGVSG